MSTTKNFLAGVAALLVVIGIIVGGYLGGWWLREDAVNREGDIRRNQFEVQETARDEVIRQATDIAMIDVDLANPELSDQQRAALEGQKRAMITQLCNVASDITGSVTPAVDSVLNQYCR